MEPRTPRWILAGVLWSMVSIAGAAVIVVNDAGDDLHSPGCATTGTGTCTLRDALTFANANAGADLVEFDIPGAGVHVIQPQSALPNVTDDGLTIDGYTQPGASTNTLARGDDAVLLIQIDGIGIPSGPAGMVELVSSNNVVRGLVLTNYPIDAGISIEGTNNFVLGNFIGTGPSGMNAQLSPTGIEVNGTGNTIGSPIPADRNVIVGGGNVVVLFTDNTVQGNYIGTNKDGTAGLGSLYHGVGANGGGNVIGGGAPGEGNLISGNGLTGVTLDSTDNVVTGNLIGTDRDGVLPVANGGDGVLLAKSSNVVAFNTIAFNGGAGVRIGQLNFVAIAGNRVSNNRIWGNGGLGIDIGDTGVLANDPGDPDVGSNMLQNYPVLASASSDGLQTTVTGSLNSAGLTPFNVEFFASAACDPSGHGPGRTPLGSALITTDASFQAPFQIVLPKSAAGFVTATATDPNGNTSEFSACVPIAFGVVSGRPALGPEFQVNTYTTGLQYRLAAAEDPHGNFVIAWSTYGQEGPGFEVYAQRYGSDGAPQGGEFRVNSYTLGHQMDPSVAMDASGDFLVAWRGEFEDGDGFGIFGQRYDASGTKVGSEFQINTYTTANQSGPSIGMTPGGDFVVAWFSDGLDGSNYGIAARRFDSSANPLGAEFQVNTYTTQNQDAPSVGMSPAGDFVIVWESVEGDGDSSGVFGQRYDASGAPLGGEFVVNEWTTGGQGSPSVAVDPGGNFIVAWSGAGGGGIGVYARRFDASGAPLGAQFSVSGSMTGQPTFPRVGADDAGNFVVTWMAYADADLSSSIFGRTFRPSGAPAGPAFPVNVYTTAAQAAASVAVNGDGDFVVAWQSQGQDGDNYGVFARRGRFRAAQPVKVDENDSLISNEVLDPDETVTVDPSWRNTGAAPLPLAGTASDFSGPAGPTYDLSDGAADYGTIEAGLTNDCTTATGDCYRLAVSGSRPSQHWDATLTEATTDGFVKPWALHVGGSFEDVPPYHLFYYFVEDLFHNGVTGGCGGAAYCPDQSAQRNQMAAFVLKSLEGSGFVPPPATGVFADVPASDPFAPWIEELYRRGVVAGCGAGPTYCPTAPVLRQQMSVFLLKTLLGSTYVPPPCTGVFGDVPCSNPFAPWIEDLFARGISAGCNGDTDFCPGLPTTRGQMAAFLSRTFGLLLYGP